MDGQKGEGAHGNDVPPRSNLCQDLPDGLQREPVPPAALDDERLEQGAEEERRRQEQGPQRLGQAGGPVADGVQRRAEAIAAHAREHAKGRQRGQGAGDGDGRDARADHRRRVAAERGRRPRLWRQVEGDHVEERVGDLCVCVSE